MVTKEEWSEWKNSVVTKKLVELIKIGKDQALDDLIHTRHLVSDFERGAIFSYTEVLELIKEGDGIYD